ncbi:MAG: OmpA family protein [Thioalkalivibrio sp.]
MKQRFTQKHSHLALSCALALGLMSGAALSQTTPQGYVVNTDNQVWRNAEGDCWRTDSGPTPASRTQCEPAPVAAPAPSAAAPEPAARPVELAQMAPVPVAMTLSAATLFAFDSADLSPEGRTELDRLARDVRNMDAERIMITGHTDRLGSAAYNQQLSEQRAQAVRAYLVSLGMDANRLQATGRGHTQPVTRAADCTGARDDRLINCLQPDRRVDVEVSGTGIPR